MINHILKRKFEVQKKLSEEAGYNLKKYVENSRSNVDSIKKKYNLTLKYVDMNPSEIQIFDDNFNAVMGGAVSREIRTSAIL